MRKSESDKNKYIKFLLMALLAVEILMIIVSNLTLIDNNLDCDNAKLMEHVIKMWEEKNMAIPNWSYKTTIEWDCTSFFAVPIYGLIKNIYVACGISNILLDALFLASIFYIFNKKDILYPLTACCIICIPYSIGMLDYFNMLFFAGAQYIIKVTIPLLFIGILINIEEGRYKDRLSKIQLAVFGLLYAVMLFTSSMSSGIYVTVTGILPAFIVYVVYKIMTWKKVPLGNICMFIYTVAAALIGTHINKLLMGGTRGESMVLNNVFNIHTNISSSFFGIFELMGGTTKDTDIMIMSAEGIAIVGKICIVILLLVCGIIALVQFVGKKADLTKIILLMIFIWNCFILDVSFTRAGSDTYEYRYHLIGIIPLICVTAIVLTDAMKKLNIGQCMCFAIAGTAALLFLEYESYLGLIIPVEKHEDLKDFVKYCDQFELDYVYMYNESDNGDICRLLSDKSQYISLCDDGSIWAYDYYEQFVDGTMQTENVIVALLDDNRDFDGDFVVAGHTLTEFDRIGSRTLYYFSD